MQAKLRATEPLLVKDPAQALFVFEREHSIDPSLEVDGVFQYNYGLALYLRDQFLPAEAAFERVLTLEPLPGRETLSHFYLAEIARRSRRPELAKKHYARALEINGAEPAIMKNIRLRAEEP